MPSKILARCQEGAWPDIEVEDDVTIYAEYEGGATGAFITTTGEPAGANRLEITLDKAKLLCEHGKLTVYELDGSTKEHIYGAAQGFGRLKGRETTPEIPGMERGQHAEVLSAFAEAVAANDPGLLYARGEEGINGLSISNAAFLSSWLGQAIDLPVDEELFWGELQKKIAGSKAKTGVEDKIAGDLESSFAK
jgi:predicted dehydrogenase